MLRCGVGKGVSSSPVTRVRVSSMSWAGCLGAGGGYFPSPGRSGSGRLVSPEDRLVGKERALLYFTLAPPPSPPKPKEELSLLLGVPLGQNLQKPGHLGTGVRSLCFIHVEPPIIVRPPADVLPSTGPALAKHDSLYLPAGPSNFGGSGLSGDIVPADPRTAVHFPAGSALTCC